MPTFGEAKRRDIVRSVLPSTRRKSARDDLNAIRRRNRRSTRQTLTYDLDDDRDFTFDDRHEIIEAVWMRRAYDKLGALQRWAPAAVADLPLEDRRDALWGMLSGNLVMRHAYSHVKDLNGVRPDDPYRPWLYDHKDNLRKNREDALRRRKAMADGLLGVLGRGRHKALNASLKRLGSPEASKEQEKLGIEPPVRCFQGIHDVDDFVRTMFTYEHRLARQVVQKFLDLEVDQYVTWRRWQEELDQV